MQYTTHLYLAIKMTDLIERLKEIQKSEGVTREQLAEKSGIKYTRLQNIFNRRTNIQPDEIEVIGGLFPRYRMWLVFGEELPEAGQTSPMTNEVKGTG